MKVTDLNTPINLNYTEEMVEKLKKYPKKPPTTEQAPSTQAILNRPVEEDEKWFNRPVSSAGQTTLSLAKTPAELDKAVATRNIPASEAAVYEYHRRAFKPTAGQSEQEGASKERKEKAVDAFIFSPAAELTDKEIKRLNALLGYESTPPGEPAPVKQSWFSAFIKSRFKTKTKEEEIPESKMGPYVFENLGYPKKED